MKPCLADYPKPPRRSTRTKKSAPVKFGPTADEVKEHKKRLRQWEEYAMGLWLGKEFPIIPDEDYFAYWDKYVRSDVPTLPVYLESTCFHCKKHVAKEEVFVCGRCPKVYHKTCVKRGANSVLCDHHYCSTCSGELNGRSFQCVMCPSSVCKKCDPVWANSESSHVCSDCFTYCCKKDAYFVLNPPVAEGIVF